MIPEFLESQLCSSGSTFSDGIFHIDKYDLLNANTLIFMCLMLLEMVFYLNSLIREVIRLVGKGVVWRE